MTRFFKNIRQKLVSENKGMAYLRYAIGEIILLVIGILIALQINNWNEGRKNAVVEEEIISNLHEEFSQNKLVLKQVRDVLDKSEKSCYQVMNLMNKGKNYLSRYNIDSLLYWSFEFNSFNPSSNVFTEILQSGRLGLIENKDIVSSLFDWQRKLDNNRYTYTIYQKFIEEQIMPYLNDNISFKNLDEYGPMQWKHPTEFNTDYSIIFSDRKFENLIDNNLYHLSLLKNEHKRIEQIMDKIIKGTKQQ
jgi:hypothetical protein